jgi:RHS repeat-associated protein
MKMYYGYCDEYQPHAVRRIYDEYNQKHYDFRWDASGNLGQVSYGNGDALFESGRFMYWTEDSRMHAAVDDRYYSYYAYDHGGERRLKLTGDNKLLDVNADFMATYTILNEHTLYPSAYMVLTNRGYTKHYYAVAERVAARLGGGLNAMGNATGYSDTLLRKADTLIDQSLEQVNSRALNGNDIDCILGNGFAKEEFGHPIDGIPCQMQAGVDFYHDPFKVMVHSMQFDHNNGQEREVYFYHSDHLGSASWKKERFGKPFASERTDEARSGILHITTTHIQHLQYLPYGEPYINQRTSGYNERYTFTGKERDEETGFGYFGARYMDHELMTMWLSVDPMADKYPSISPYAYCTWNPMKLVDPYGEMPRLPLWLRAATSRHVYEAILYKIKHTKKIREVINDD